MKKWLFLLRAFFPSWKFFDDVGTELQLEVRFGKDEAHLSEWTNCLQPISRSFKNILINSKGNYLHACHNHLTHLQNDLNECDTNIPESITQLVTYKITRNMARHQISELKLAAAPFVYQFRLSARDFKSIQKKSDHLLISEIYGS